jgi:amphi-Trp domain-containing protein
VVFNLNKSIIDQEKPVVEIEKALKKKEAVALLKEITKALESDAAKTINVADLTIDLPKKMEFSLEYEVDDEKTELEIEFGWSNKKRRRKGKFEVFKSADEQWCFHLKAPDGKVILASEEYHNKQGALKGVESVKKNAQTKQFEVRESQAGQPYFVLKAKNHQVIGTSQMYKRRAGCNKGIKSVIKNAPEAKLSLDEA